MPYIYMRCSDVIVITRRHIVGILYMKKSSVNLTFRDRPFISVVYNSTCQQFASIQKFTTFHSNVVYLHDGGIYYCIQSDATIIIYDTLLPLYLFSYLILAQLIIVTFRVRFLHQFIQSTVISLSLPLYVMF